jgi:hypothetical protein
VYAKKAGLATDVAEERSADSTTRSARVYERGFGDVARLIDTYQRVLPEIDP